MTEAADKHIPLMLRCAEGTIQNSCECRIPMKYVCLDRVRQGSRNANRLVTSLVLVHHV